MPAYNRVTQQFQDGFDLDASDLNALRADLRTWVGQQIAALPSGGGVVSGPTRHVLLRDGVSRVLCRDGTFLTFR